MHNYLSYPWAILFGLYYYLLFHLIFLMRFGSINTSVNILDIFIVLVGMLSTVLYVFFAKKLPRRRALLLIPFLIALPFSVIGSVGGGLLGPIGILIFGLAPFAITLPLGYWLIKRSTTSSTEDVPPTVGVPPTAPPAQ